MVRKRKNNVLKTTPTPPEVKVKAEASHSASSKTTLNADLVDNDVLAVLEMKWPCPPSWDSFFMWQPSCLSRTAVCFVGIYVWATLTCSFPLVIPAGAPLFDADAVCESVSLENSRNASIATVVLWVVWHLSVFIDRSRLKRAISTLDSTLISLLHPWATFENLLSKEDKLKEKVSFLRLEKGSLVAPKTEQMELDEMTTKHAEALEEIEKKWAATRQSDEAARKVGSLSLCVQHNMY